MPESPPSLRLARPVLDGSLRGKSYLEEHQQYRPPHQDLRAGIDSVVEGLPMRIPVTRKISSYRGVPIANSPPKIVESGLNHTFSHSNCAPLPGESTNRVVATLFYKASESRIPHVTSNSSLPKIAEPSQIPANFAPTTSISEFPLEPPEPDAEPLDHLYGSFISPLCVTSFLALISSLPLPRGTSRLNSSHRCLDSPDHPRVVELTFSPAPDPAYLPLLDLRKHELLYRFERDWHIDVVLQPDCVTRRYPRLVVFDMDSTLIENEVIDLIAASIGIEPQVSAITARAMHGELDFAASFRERVALLKGVDAAIFTKLRDIVTITPGVKDLLRALKRLGVKTAVLSGGFIPLTQWLATSLGIDYAFANTVEIAESTSSPSGHMLTGKVSGPIVDAQRKADLLVEIAGKEGISLDQVVAVGDGANDLLMMGQAALGVAWRAKPLVQMEAGARLNGDSLLDLLFLFGCTAEEVQALLK